jgi:hypothetical protein
MLFASGDTNISHVLIFLGLVMLGMRKTFRAFDSEGAVKKAAQNGVVGFIGRWLR